MDYELQSFYKPIGSLSIHLFIQTGHSRSAFKGEYTQKLVVAFERFHNLTIRQATKEFVIASDVFFFHGKNTQKNTNRQLLIQQ